MPSKKNGNDGRVTELAAWRKWRERPEEVREMLLSNAFCPNCFVTSFAPGWTIRQDKYGLLIEGECSMCGHPVARMVEEV